MDRPQEYLIGCNNSTSLRKFHVAVQIHCLQQKRRKTNREKSSKLSSMAIAASGPAAYLRKFEPTLSTFNSQLSRISPAKKALTIVAMAPQKKVNKYNPKWKKQWYGAGIFVEGSEDVEFDVFKELEKKKVLSNVEKAGLLSKAEKLGFTLSSIEKLGVFSKAEELGLLSLLEKVASVSPAAMASASLPLFVAAIAAIVLIPDDSVALVVVQATIAGALGAGAAGLLVGSVVLDGLQEAD